MYTCIKNKNVTYTYIQKYYTNYATKIYHSSNCNNVSNEDIFDKIVFYYISHYLSVLKPSVIVRLELSMLTKTLIKDQDQNLNSNLCSLLLLNSSGVYSSRRSGSAPDSLLPTQHCLTPFVLIERLLVAETA